MPRGGRRTSGRSSPTMSRKSPAPPPSRSVPATRPQTNVAQPGSVPSQPGLLGQMASTAAGVAIGHTVGHAVTGALFGGSGGENQATDQQAGAAPYQSYQQPVSEQQQQNPCQYELQQFVECAQNQRDISLCQGFNEVLRQCKLSHGLS